MTASSSSAAARAATRPPWSPPSSAPRSPSSTRDGARRLGGAHRLRAQQDPDRDRRADDRRRRRRRARRQLRTTTRATRPRRSRVDLPGSTRGSSSSPPTSPPTSPRRLEREGVRVVRGRGRLDGPDRVVVDDRRRRARPLDADAVLVATGAAPRTLPDAPSPTASGSSPGSRSTTSTELPERARSWSAPGVTGAEFASAYLALGVDVTLVSSPRPGAARRGRRRGRGARGRARPAAA